MRTIIYCILLLVLFSTCKRKRTEVSKPNNLAEYPAHCYNGNFDTLETGIDCGGPCALCDIAVATCTQTTNRLTFNGSNYNIISTGCGNQADPSYYDFTGNVMGGTLTVRVTGTVPDMSSGHPISSSSFPSGGEAYVNLNSPTYGNMTAATGTVFINQVGGKFYATVCNTSFHSFVTSQSYSGIVNITCQ